MERINDRINTLNELKKSNKALAASITNSFKAYNKKYYAAKKNGFLRPGSRKLRLNEYFNEYKNTAKELDGQQLNMSFSTLMAGGDQYRYYDYDARKEYNNVLKFLGGSNVIDENGKTKKIKRNYKIEFEYSIAVDNNFAHNITRKATINLQSPNKKLKGAKLREWRLNQLQKLDNNQFAGLLRAIGYSTEEIDQFYGY